MMNKVVRNVKQILEFLIVFFYVFLVLNRIYNIQTVEYTNTEIILPSFNISILRMIADTFIKHFYIFSCYSIIFIFP